VNKYIFFLGLLNILYADFPLNGQSWIFVEGGNPNAFSILEDVNPKRIFWVYFEDDNNVQMKYLNLMDSPYSSVFDMATDIQKEFRYTFSGKKGSPFKNLEGFEIPPIFNWVKSKTIGRTYSCKEAIKKRIDIVGIPDYYDSYRMVGKTNDEDYDETKSIWEIDKETITFSQMPSCELIREGQSPIVRFIEAKVNDGVDFKKDVQYACVDGWCNISEEMQDRRVMEVDKKLYFVMTEAFKEEDIMSVYTENVYTLSERNMETIPMDADVYILHLFPQLTWSPRNSLTGKPLGELYWKNTQEMREARLKALSERVTKLEAGWRSPLMVEEKSAVYSVAFDIGSMEEGKWLYLNDKSVNNRWQSNPAWAYKVGEGNTINGMDVNSIAVLLLKIFSKKESPERYEFYDKIEENCGAFWLEAEKEVADYLWTYEKTISANPNIEYCYGSSSDELAARTDGREERRVAEQEYPCALFWTKVENRNSGGNYCYLDESDENAANEDGREAERREMLPVSTCDLYAGVGMTIAYEKWTLAKNNLGEHLDVSQYLWRGCPDPNFGSLPGIPSYEVCEHVPPAGAPGNCVNLNRNDLRKMLISSYPRCGTAPAMDMCVIADYVLYLTEQYPSLDFSGTLASSAWFKRKVACDDYAHIKKSLEGITDAEKKPFCSSEGLDLHTPTMRWGVNGRNWRPRYRPWQEGWI
jgi:hypothetical protein